MTGFRWGWWREPGHGFDECWTRVGGRWLRSLEAGTVRGLPEVVLVPGLGAPFYVGRWAELIAAWTRVSILDVPGWRGGRARSSPPTVQGVAAATGSWLAVTGRRSVVLVGHSSGAQSVIRTAQLVPRRLCGLVLAGPTVAVEARPPQALVRRVVGTFFHEELPELAAVLPSHLRSGGLPLARLVGSVLRDRPEDAVAGLLPPVFVLTGERDRLAPPSWAMHLAQLASAPCLVLPGAHNSCFTFPQHSDAALRQAVTGWTGVKSGEVPSPGPAD